LKKLEAASKRNRAIGDVRGLGLMCAIELVSDPAKRTPIQIDKSNAIVEELRKRFVLAGKAGVFGNVLRFKPPMCINKQDVDYVVAALEDSLKTVGV